MRDITLEELLAAGCHFGHQVNRRNPKADEYIFEERAGVHIINLEKTREGLVAAGAQMKQLGSEKAYVVVVGTKRQAQQIVEEQVKHAREVGANGLFYVTTRWVGGTLTNFSEVSKNFKKLVKLNEFLKEGNKDGEYTKHEMLLFERERDKLNMFYEGIMDMDRIPDALCIIGTQLEQTAVAEAQSNGIDIIGIVDTNSDPLVVNYPIPANDDAVGSIKLITEYLVEAWIEGTKDAAKEDEKAKNAEAKAAAKVEKKAVEPTAEAKAKKATKTPKKTKAPKAAAVV